MSDKDIDGWMRVYPVINLKVRNQEFAFQNVIQPRFVPQYYVDFSFEAMWIGEEEVLDLNISFEGLQQIILSGQIGTRTRYHIVRF